MYLTDYAVSFTLEYLKFFQKYFFYSIYISLSEFFSLLPFRELDIDIRSIPSYRYCRVENFWISEKYFTNSFEIFCRDFCFLTYWTSNCETRKSIIITRKKLKSYYRSKELKAENKKHHRNKYRKSSKESMFEKVSQNLFIPLCTCMDDAYPQRDMPFSDASFSSAFESEELLLFIGCIFDSMWIIDVALSLPHEEEIECTIYRECQDKSCSKYSKYRDRYICEKFPENSRKCHHRDKYDDSRHNSRDNRHCIFTKREHDSGLWIVSDSDFSTCSLYDHDDSIDCYTK